MLLQRAVGILVALAGLFVFASCRSQIVDVTRQEPTADTGTAPEATVAEVDADSAAPATGAVQPGDDDLVTLDLVSLSEIPTLDPQAATDAVSVSYIESLFVQLTNWNFQANEIVPEAALRWEISDDGLLYTFHLRSDIPWVYHDPVTGETVPVVDEMGQARYVTAGDFVIGVQRACHPDTASFYGGVLGRVIRGCEELLQSEESEVQAALLAALGVSAPDNETVVVELKAPAGYFISMTHMWTLSAVPSWTIEEHGDAEWTQPGNIVTNGRYVLHEWHRGVRRTLLRNPHLPADLRGEGNVERIVERVVPDASTSYALWLNGDVDLSDLPDAEVSAHLAAYPEETRQLETLSVGYIGFVTTKAPFDDARVRRAFAAAIDRETLVRDVRQGQALPMIHLAPPGIFGAPPIDEVGVGFNPEYARLQLAAAGYPDCRDFPVVSLLGLAGQDLLNLIEYLQGQWEEHLECPAHVVQIEQQSFAELLASVDAKLPVEDVPHMFTLGWGPDYRDENNWVGDVLWCGNEDALTRRACSAVDDMIIEAARESDPARRVALYRQIEESFFGAQGEMPIVPVYLNMPYEAVQHWVDRASTLSQWYNWRIDWEAKKDGRE